MNTKLKKSIIVLMVFLVLIISIGPISATADLSTNEMLASNDNIDLNDNLKESSTDTLSSNEKTFTDLNTEINNNNEVNLEADYVYSSGDSFNNGIQINKEVTINGHGHTVNPNGNLLFDIGTDGLLTLNDMTIVNTYSSPNPMIKNGGTLILNNVTFTVERHILSSFTSGSKYITIENDGIMNVENCTFKDSYIHSDAITSTTKQLSIYGLIYNTNTITIKNTIFENNKLYNPSTDKMGKTIDICAILHNKNNMALDNITIKNTNVSYVAASGNHFEGIIFNEKGTLTINRSTIVNNSIIFPNTKNIYLKGIIYSESSDSILNVSNTLIADNTNLQMTDSKPMIEYKGIADLNSNYWGTNTPNFKNLITGTEPTNYINITFNPSEVTAGEEKVFDITFSLNDEIVTAMPTYNITIRSDKTGTKIVKIENGIGHYNYISNTPGNDTIHIQDNEYTITTTMSQSGTFTDLNELISKNSEIELTKDYTFDETTDSALQTGIQIDKEVTINGNGYTINSTDLARLFNIGTAGKLTLKNITLITNNVVTSSATSNENILNKGELNFDGVIFTSQRIWTTGTVIASAIFNYDDNSKMSINNSIFKDSLVNYTSTTGTLNPYGLIYNKGSLSINNTIFRNNGIYSTGKALSSQNGGLIYDAGNSLVIENTQIEKNFVKHNTTGNAISVLYGLIYVQGKTVTINNCNFKENNISTISENANANAFGVICMKGGELNIANSKFIKNNAKTGSAISTYLTATTINSNNNIFEENTATNGGAIYIHHNSTILNSENDIYKKNAAENGGAIYVKTSNSNIGEISVKNSIFEENDANIGSAIYSSNKTNVNKNYWGNNNPKFEILITDGINSQTPNNHAILVIEGDSEIIPEYTKTYSVRFKTNDTNDICELPDYKVNLTATNKLSDENITIKGASASFNYTSTLDEITDIIRVSVNSIELATFEVTVKEDANAKGTFKELERIIRKSTDEINLIKDYSFDATIDSGLENGIVIDKQVIINGHRFKINSTNLAKLFSVTKTGNLTLKDVIVLTDYATTGNPVKDKASLKNNGIVTLDNVTFTSKQTLTTATTYLSSPIYNNGILNIANSKFINSTIETSAQTCYGLIDNDGELKISNTIFDKNSIIESSKYSAIYANGLIHNKGNLTLNRVNVTNNNIKTPYNSYGIIRGGTNGAITINNSIFENNVLDSKDNNAQGTVLYLESGTAKISNSKFIKNIGARSCGAIYTIIPTTFINNTFEKNTATDSGGAIYTGNAKTSFTNNTFKENEANTGGAIYSSELTSANGNQFISNHATKHGGAIYSNTIGTVEKPIENNIFINNEALENGGAIYSKNGVRINKSTIQGNKAENGAAIYSAATGGSESVKTSSITNTIFDSNIIKSSSGKLVHFYGKSIAENNYWGNNNLNFTELIGVNGGTFTAPENITIIIIEGNTTLSSSDTYTVKFVNNNTGITVALNDYEAEVSSNLNPVTPTIIGIKNGVGSFRYNAENNGQDTIKISKNNVEITNATVTVSLPKKPVNIDDALVIVNDKNLTFTFTFKLPENAMGTFTVKIGETTKTASLVNGSATIKLSGLPAGLQTANITYSGDENFESSAKQTNITVAKQEVKSSTITTVTAPKYGKTASYVIKLPATATGTLTVTVDGKKYTKTIVNGEATVTIPKLAVGKHTIKIAYSGDNNYKGVSKTSTVTIVKPKVTPTIYAKNKVFKVKTKVKKYSITLKHGKKALKKVKVYLKVKGKTYTAKTNSKGEATFKITKLTKKGIYKSSITYKGSATYKKVTKYVKITAKR